VQSVLRPVKGGAITKRGTVQKKNPLLNKQVLLRLNPYAAVYSKDGIGHAKVNEDKPEGKDEAFKDTLMDN
jgi:large subunit ribosomal protein L4e